MARPARELDSGFCSPGDNRKAVSEQPREAGLKGPDRRPDTMNAEIGVEALHAKARQALVAGKAGEALALYSDALRLRPSFEAYENSAIALSRLGRDEEAVMLSNRILQHAPDSAVAWGNHALFLRRLDRLTEAAAALERALELAPQFHDARTKLGLCLLSLGRYREGFALLERRWEWPPWRALRQRFPQPQWSGAEPLCGKRILFHADAAGYGDAIQLFRYARLAVGAGASVMLEVQPKLKPLLGGSAHVAAVATVGEKLPEFDLHCPFSALPYLFGTTVETVPCAIPYLYALPSYRDKWASILDGPAAAEHRPSHTRMRVGFVYRGNTAHMKGDDERQIPLATFLRLLAGIPWRWYCLQCDATESERGMMRRMPNVVHLGSRIDDWADTAAIVDQLDLVVSIDTALAHLAGAVGKPLLVLTPFSPAWQWRSFGGGPAWYPAARVWRQPRAGDWAGLIAAIRAAADGGRLADY
jgi:hypothetical protein